MPARKNLTHLGEIRDVCLNALVALADYQSLLSRHSEHQTQKRLAARPARTGQNRLAGTRRVELLGPAKMLWKDMEKKFHLLLNCRLAAEMDAWIVEHPEHILLETAGFFDNMEGMPWGAHLTRIIEWCHQRGCPFGFFASDDNAHVDDLERQEFLCTDVVEDLQWEIRALLARASELLAKAEVDLGATEPLKDDERAVLDLITTVPIRGKEILAKLNGTGNETNRGTLTSRIIPKLTAHYRVERCSGGYVRRLGR